MYLWWIGTVKSFPSPYAPFYHPFFSPFFTIFLLYISGWGGLNDGRETAKGTYSQLLSRYYVVEKNGCQLGFLVQVVFRNPQIGGQLRKRVICGDEQRIRLVRVVQHACMTPGTPCPASPLLLSRGTFKYICTICCVTIHLSRF